MEIRSEKSEEEVLISLKEGDISALSVLYKNHAGQLYSFVLRIAKSHSLTEDVIQDTFIRVWECRVMIDSSKPFKPFLYTVAKRHLLNLIKRASHEHSIVEEIKGSTVYYENVTDLQTEFSERTNLLNEAVKSLSPRLRDVFVRCKIDGYSYKEAASEFGITEGTVNSQIVKATRSVKKFFLLREIIIFGILVFH